MNSAERAELAALLPPPEVSGPPSARMLGLEEGLLREIGRVPAAAPRPRSRRFAVRALPVAVAAAVVGAVATGGLGRGPDEPRTDRTAVVMLDRIATAAAASGTTPVRDDQYVFTQVQGVQKIMDKGEDVFRRSDWKAVGGDRSGLARITVLSGPSGRGTREMRLDANPDAVTYRELRRLPTAPAELYSRIWERTEGQGPTHEEAALEHIGAMLPTAVLLPELDAALYRAAARIPGVTFVRRAHDAAHREGIGLAFGSGGDRHVWVFDRTTLGYLGSDEVALLRTGVADTPGGSPTG
ncbi:CU044_5270 family protein [Streptomyces sp. NPDC051014]|uniref:CU044_5270 family protein n=1 Tax=Streptomyces sp. NPDC051014 TaxID=3155751 RepID=UPI0033E17F2A